MNPEEMFNWPDGDVILRATQGADSRDFRVHKLILSISSPVFKDMFRISQPSSVASNGVDVVDVTDPPRALEIVLRFVYPSVDPPVVDDLTALSEALVLADKYDIVVARSRLRSSFREFATTEPLRAYAIACRLGFEDEMKTASSHTTSIHPPGLAELPDEFKLIPATEYHRLILLHSRYRREVASIVDRSPATPLLNNIRGRLGFTFAGGMKKDIAEEVGWRLFIKSIAEGIPLNHETLVLSLKGAGNAIHPFSGNEVESDVSSILSQASALNLTV